MSKEKSGNGASVLSILCNIIAWVIGIVFLFTGNIIGFVIIFVISAFTNSIFK